MVVSCQHTFTAYVISFEKATIGVSVGGSALLSLLWTATITSRIVSILYQLRGYSNKLLIEGTITLCVTASLASLALYPSIYYPHSAIGKAGVWIAAACFGASYGPIPGWLFDLQHRITVSKEVGVAIMMFSINMGSAIMPSLMVTLWSSAKMGPLAFPLVIGVLALVGLALTVELRRRYSCSEGLFLLRTESLRKIEMADTTNSTATSTPTTTTMASLSLSGSYVWSDGGGCDDDDDEMGNGSYPEKWIAQFRAS